MQISTELAQSVARRSRRGLVVLSLGPLCALGGVVRFQSGLFSLPAASPSWAPPASIIISAQEPCATMWMVEFVKNTITGHISRPITNTTLGNR